MRQSAWHPLIIIDGDSLSLSNRMAGWLLMLGNREGGVDCTAHTWTTTGGFSRPIEPIKVTVLKSAVGCHGNLSVEFRLEFGPAPQTSYKPPSPPPLQKKKYFKAEGLTKASRLNSVISALKPLQGWSDCLSQHQTWWLIFRLILWHFHSIAKLYFYFFYLQTSFF